MSAEKRTDISRHMEFLGFSERDDKIIACIHEVIDDRIDTIITDFYDHLNEFPERADFLSSPGIVAHLKHVQRQHLLDLGLRVT